MLSPFLSLYMNNNILRQFYHLTHFSMLVEINEWHNYLIFLIKIEACKMIFLSIDLSISLSTFNHCLNKSSQLVL